MTTATVPSAAGLVLRAGDTLDAAGLDTDALAAALDAANAVDTHDTYGAHYDDAIRRARNTIARRADRLGGTHVVDHGRRGGITATFTPAAVVDASLARALHGIADALNSLLLRAH